jgi:hypothetical protein
MGELSTGMEKRVERLMIKVKEEWKTLSEEQKEKSINHARIGVENIRNSEYSRTFSENLQIALLKWVDGGCQY